jgi:molybdopterin-guanine dinucleotide biosynthesis protein A
MGFIAAGGQSSRMGRDKAWLQLGDRTLIERVIAALSPVTLAVAIIANSPEYLRLGLPVFCDENESVGPLEAIRVALSRSRTELVVLVGCDLPFVRSELFEYLLDVAADYEAVVPVGPDGRLEPLCAVYSTSALGVVTSLVASGERKAARVFESVRSRRVAFDEIRHLAGSEFFFENINTPEDYLRAIDAATRFGL